MNEKIKCLNIAYIFKASIGSINGSWTEGNVSTVKKITLPHGAQIPYVSGQSLKYQIRRYWKEDGLEMSEVALAENKKKGVDMTQGDPLSFIDDDLLGYMIASKKENRRRTAPVRISPAIGLFEFKGDRDMGTKSKEGTSGDMGAGGNIFETELYYNYFKVNVLVELDRVGKFEKFETADKESVNTDNESQLERLIKLLEAIQYMWGGGKQSRLLSDMSPKFTCITFQSVKSPIFLEGLKVDEEEKLDTRIVQEILSGNSSIIKNQFLGYRKGVFKNEEDINSLENISSTEDSFKGAKEYLNDLYR